MDNHKTTSQLCTRDGKVVPAVYKVISHLNNPGLVNWANRLGLAGVTLAEHGRTSGATGRAIHSAIEAYLKTGSFATGSPIEDGVIREDYQESLNKFSVWIQNKNLEFIDSELTVVSELKEFGGRIDFYVKIDGQLTLLEIKTSKFIFTSHKLQAVAYAGAMIENKHPVERVMVVTFPKEKEFPTSEWVGTKETLPSYKEIFLALLQINKHVGLLAAETF